MHNARLIIQAFTYQLLLFQCLRWCGGRRIALKGLEIDGWGDRVCPFVILCDCIVVWAHVCVCFSVCIYHIGSIKKRWNWMEVYVDGVCVSLRLRECDSAVRCSQPLMTFACCRCEQNDPAVLIKTNGTDRSPLIVFHWQMAPLTPEDCCRGPACLEQTDFTNENRRSVSVCTIVCVRLCIL